MEHFLIENTDSKDARADSADIHYMDTESVSYLKDHLYLELMGLQEYPSDGKNKERVIALARGVISCLEKMHGKRYDSGPREKRGLRFNKSIKKALYKKIGGCLACGGGTTGNASRHDAPIELHHIIPRSYDGAETRSNALLVCRDCHVLIHN